MIMLSLPRCRTQHLNGFCLQEKAEILRQVAHRIAAKAMATWMENGGAEKAGIIMQALEEHMREAARQPESGDSLAVGNDLPADEAATVSSADRLAAGNSLSADGAATVSSADEPVQEDTMQEDSTRLGGCRGSRGIKWSG